MKWAVAQQWQLQLTEQEWEEEERRWEEYRLLELESRELPWFRHHPFSVPLCANL